MPTYPRERFGYSSPFTRPPLKLPGKGRMIVWSVVNVEEWEITRPMARQLSIAPQGQSAIPDMPNWTWYEYGMRVGFWRLLRALQKAKATPTMSLNAKVCETYPEVSAAARDAGWEFMAHAYVQMPIQQITDQRAVIRQSIEVLQKFTGKRPTGWLGPGRGQTFETLDYVTEAGLSWFGDWVLDDQPFWVKTANGPILSIPYSAEINDITIMVSHHHESDVLPHAHQGRVRPALSGVETVAAHPGDRRAPLRHRRRPSHQVFRAALRLHQQASRRGALDRPADLRLVREAGAEARGVRADIAGGPGCASSDQNAVRQRRLFDLSAARSRIESGIGMPSDLAVSYFTTTVVPTDTRL